MILRKSKKNDVEQIMEMIGQAQEYLKQNNVDQWQNGYPNHEVIENDIEKEWSYVLELNEKVVASVAISFEGEPTYDQIYKGDWLGKQSYAVVHRLVVNNAYKGKAISSEILKKVEEYCINREVYSIRSDTHERNFPMQKVLEKNNYSYCGKIFTEDGSPRIAFEKLLG